MLQEARWKLEYFAFRTIAAMIEMLTVRQTVRMASGLAWLFADVLPKKVSRYNVAYDNLKKSFPEQSDEQIHETIRKMWNHLFRLVAELIQFPRKITLESSREVIRFHDRHLAVEALNTGRPVFVLGGHFGNWEASMTTFGLFGFRFGVVARKLDNPYLHDWFMKAREVTGHQLLLKRGGWDGMVDLLNHGGNLGLLCDQDAGKRGVFVEFFGRPASTNKSLALMAMEYNALIVVGYGIRVEDDLDHARWVRFEIGCEELIDPNEIESADPVTEITTRYSKALERAIRRAPEQYFWVHRRWKSEPRVRRKKEKSDLGKKAA